MTLSDLKTMDAETITPAVAAELLGCNPHYIRVAAHQDKSLLGFPVILLGNRVKIPRVAFIKFMEGDLN
ncbi:DNA-binding protein [Intestinibacillus sp. Marseille-P6563]|uniref:DNA-binding protein n=1 Tax=Intestinibacillus sp. Marseille-P6563 TaxID=2364792 RepID=UPI000F0633F9|nr:DNA-binding protein [Intestinibacillus sp. Marseille-P6563]